MTEPRFIVIEAPVLRDHRRRSKPFSRASLTLRLDTIRSLMHHPKQNGPTTDVVPPP